MTKGEEAIISLQLNGVPRGDFVGIKTADDFWIKLPDLARLRLNARPQPVDGHVSLRSLGATNWQFDDSTLVLRADLPSDMLQGTRISVGSGPTADAGGDAPASLILSYRLSTRTASSVRTTTADTDLNVRVGPLLLRQESRLNLEGVERGYVRGRTQAIVDDRERARRWIAGDVLSTAGSFGTTTTGAGLLVQKVWNMTPNAPRQPRARIAGSTAVPADVELAVDGATIFRGRVAPGPVEFDNLQYYGGQRNLRLTITDANGRQQVIEQPFLFADSVLAAGVHDYTYFAGRRSDLGPSGSWRYEEPIAQAFHRYGLSDSITVNAGGEGSERFLTAGGGATLRNDRLGLFSLDLLGQRDRDAGVERAGWSGRYSFQAPQFSVVAGVRGFQSGFRSFRDVPALFPLREARVVVNQAFGAASVGLDLLSARTTMDRKTSAALRLYTSLGNSLLSAELRTSRIGAMRENVLAVFWRMNLDPVTWAGASLNLSDNDRTLTLDTGRQVPAGEGFGYRASLSDTRTPVASSRIGTFAGTWNFRSAALDVTAAQAVDGSSSSGEASVSGALVSVGGHVGAARLVGDSFALARLGAPLAGVDVLLNNQVQGKTDSRGELIIPNLGAFDHQEVRVDDRQLPIAYQLESPTRKVAPAYRSGSVVDFGLRIVRAITGKAWRLQQGQRTPLGSYAWTMASPAGSLRIETTSGGEFYVEDAPAGTYTGELRIGDAELSCKLQVPERSTPVEELTEGIVCE